MQRHLECFATVNSASHMFNVLEKEMYVAVTEVRQNRPVPANGVVE